MGIMLLYTLGMPLKSMYKGVLSVSAAVAVRILPPHYVFLILAFYL